MALNNNNDNKDILIELIKYYIFEKYTTKKPNGQILNYIVILPKAYPMKTEHLSEQYIWEAKIIKVIKYENNRIIPLLPGEMFYIFNGFREESKVFENWKTNCNDLYLRNMGFAKT